MKKLSVIFLLPAGLFAAQVNYSGQGEAFPLLNRSVGARALAMGSAFEAMAEGSSGALYNPAAPGFSSGLEMGLHHGSLLAGTAHETLSLDAPLGSWGGIGVEGSWVNYPGITLRDSRGYAQGDYQPTDQALGLEWAKAWSPGLSLGVSAKGMRESLPGASYQAMAWGSGALWKPRPELSLAAVAKALPQGQGGSFMRYAVGAAWRAESLLGGPLSAALSARIDGGAPGQLNLGLEKGFSSLMGMSLRAGYSRSFSTVSMGDLDGLSLGAGFRISSLEFDYAWLPMGDFGSVHQISLGWKFDPLRDAPATAPKSSASQDLAEAGRLVQALKLDPQNATSWKALGAVYQRLGKQEWARQCFDTAAKLESKP